MPHVTAVTVFLIVFRGKTCRGSDTSGTEKTGIPPLSGKSVDV